MSNVAPFNSGASDDCDVLVVGAGLAGLTAGIRAAELGLRVRIIERGEGDHYLCNSRYTGGLFHIGMDNLASPPDEIRSRLQRVTNGEGRPELADALAENAIRAVTWLKAHGVSMIRVGPDGLRQHSLAPPGVRRTGLNWRWRSGDVMLRTLGANYRGRGGILQQGTEVSELLMESGRCVGASVRQNGVTRAIRAQYVVLSDGGFQANADLLRRFVSGAPERLLMRNAETGRGDGLRMAEAVGAKIVGTSSFYGHVQYRAAMTDGRFWPYPVVDSLAVSALLIDGASQRFCDEGLGGVHITNCIARLPDPLSAVIIMDDAIWNGPGKDWLLPANPYLIRAGGELITASDLNSLAAKIGHDPGALNVSVARWNDQVAGRKPFDVPRTVAPYKPWAIGQGKFHAIPVCAGVTYTMGGILTDTAARVLDANERPIQGLLAAGATTGGLEGFSRDGYSGGLSKALTFGLIAGETAYSALRKAA
ncbi:MAG: FAD-binding protein [Alphaproteobacteria bacterium]|nr:FAD-binding protein [Alphaproteobacteria bacterium]